MDEEYDYALDMMVLEQKLEEAVKALEFYASREYYPKGGMQFFPAIARHEDNPKSAKEALKKLNLHI